MNTSSMFDTNEEIERIYEDILVIHHYKPSPPERSFLVESTKYQPFIPPFAPLWALQIKGKLYKLSLPIEVHISKEGDLYFAENETLLLSGSGQSIREAIEDIQSDVFYFWNYYRNLSPDEIIGDASRLKEIYENLVIEE